jgi:quercetin dioxygenase-like cupin family protein
MASRDPTLQRFLDATDAAIRARAEDHPAAMPMADRISAALKDRERSMTAHASARVPAHLPACRHLDEAFARGAAGTASTAGATTAFKAIVPQLTWYRRAGAAEAGQKFFDGHANAIIVGEEGLETVANVRIGVSLVAPGVQYPRHRHPPEELYVVLSPGFWMQNDYPTAFKGSGDLVHNPPNVWHAMDAGEAPLLAIWCLWVENDDES